MTKMRTPWIVDYDRMRLIGFCDSCDFVHDDCENRICGASVREDRHEVVFISDPLRAIPLVLDGYLLGQLPDEEDIA